MNLKKVELIKQLHRTYGCRIDSVISNSKAPLYQRSCHRNQVSRLRNWLNR